MIVSSLRQKNMMALYTACGDIRDVKIEDNELLIFIKDEYLYSLVMNEKNYKTLSDLLGMFASKTTLKFQLLEKKVDYIENNIKKLKNFFGDNLTIK